MTMSDLTNSDTAIMVEEGKKDADSARMTMSQLTSSDTAIKVEEGGKAADRTGMTMSQLTSSDTAIKVEEGGNAADRTGMTMSEFTNYDTAIKVDEGKKSADSTSRTMSEFTNSDATLKVEEGEKAADSTGSKTSVSRYLEVFAAEFVGTGVLLFIGCASCIQGDDNQPVTDFHSSLTFGFIVSTVICVFGHISAAHVNPAVTAAFFVLKHIDVPLMLVYFVAQISGAILGVGLLVLLTPGGWIRSDMCVTQPHDTMKIYQAVGIEFVATMVLIFLVCGLCDPRCAARQDSVPLKFAAVLIALCLAIGKYTGASMNPARSLGPAIWSGNWNQHWIYWLSPMSAGFITPLFYTICFLRGVQ